MISSRQISELVRINTAFGSNSSKSLFSDNNESSQLGRLARNFARAEDGDEKRWALDITGGESHEHPYVRLRSRLKRRLLNDLFLLNLSGGSDLRRAMYRNYKVLFMVKTLLLLGARRVAVWLIPAALERARKYELTGDRVDLLSILRQDASFNGNRTKFRQYAEELEEALALRRAELRISFLLQQLEVEIVGRATPSAKAIEIAAGSVTRARELFDEFPTFLIGLGYFRIATVYAEIVRDHTRCLQLSEKAEEYLSRFPNLRSPAFHGEFAVKRLASALYLLDLERGVEAAQYCNRYYPAGVNNWFVWKGYELMLCMHALKFNEAALVHAEVVTHERFASQPEQVRQKWLLFGHYVQIARSLALGADNPAIRRAIRAIVREVPIYTKDKAGYNISLLIIRYLVLLSESEFSTITEQSEALAQYVQRHLRTKRETALYAFLRSLLVLERRGFRLPRPGSRAEMLVQQFTARERDEVDESQVLPFSYMWRLIVESLEPPDGTRK